MRALAALLGLTLLGIACKGTSSTTSPSSDTVAPATMTENFADTLPVGGFKFYTFLNNLNGTVNVTLVSVTGTGVPPTVTLGLVIGTPSGADCGATSSINAQAGTDPQLTGTFGPGRICVKVADIGNLVAPATFLVTIGHP